MHYQTLVAQHTIISEQTTAERLAVVLRELEQLLLSNHVDGAVVEFGCYIGTTSLYIRRLLNAYPETPRAFHVYDSFDGLPAKTAPDESPLGVDFKAGELRVTKKQLLQAFSRAHLQAPVIHKSWFRDLQPSDLPDTISYAYVDGDFYESITASLRFVWSRLSPGGTITIDDYGREALPGVTRAVRDFFAHIPVTIRQEQQTAIVRAA